MPVRTQVMFDRLADYARLFMDFLGHKMLIAIFVITSGLTSDGAHFTISKRTLGVPNLN